MKQPSSYEYQKAMEAFNKRSSRQFKFLLLPFILIFVLLVFGLVLLGNADEHVYNSDGIEVQTLASRLLAPYWIGFAVCLAAVITVSAIFLSRCPKCRRFFPRGKLELYDTIESQSTASDGTVSQSVKRVYVTECKYCKEVLWIVRG